MGLEKGRSKYGHVKVSAKFYVIGRLGSGIESNIGVIYD
jgi:hypothetical protein